MINFLSEQPKKIICEIICKRIVSQKRLFPANELGTHFVNGKTNSNRKGQAISTILSRKLLDSVLSRIIVYVNNKGSKLLLFFIKDALDGKRQTEKSYGEK